MSTDPSPADRATPIHEFLTPEEQLGPDAVVRSRGWLLAIDRETVAQPLDAFPLVLCPAQSGDEFTVFRARERFTIPEDACLERLPTILTVVEGTYQYALLQCRLVSPADDDAVPTDRLLTAPPELQGRTIPETQPTRPPFWDALVQQQHAATETDGPAAADGVHEPADVAVPPQYFEDS